MLSTVCCCVEEQPPLCCSLRSPGFVPKDLSHCSSVGCERLSCRPLDIVVIIVSGVLGWIPGLNSGLLVVCFIDYYIHPPGPRGMHEPRLSLYLCHKAQASQVPYLRSLPRREVDTKGKVHSVFAFKVCVVCMGVCVLVGLSPFKCTPAVSHIWRSEEGRGCWSVLCTLRQDLFCCSLLIDRSG